MLPLSMGMLLFGKGTTINNGVFYKLVNYILFKGCLLGRFSTSRTASFVVFKHLHSPLCAYLKNKNLLYDRHKIASS